MAGKQKNKNRKIGRNKDAAKAYKLSFTRERNKVARLRKVLDRNPNDKDALRALERFKDASKGIPAPPAKHNTNARAQEARKAA